MIDAVSGSCNNAPIKDAMEVSITGRQTMTTHTYSTATLNDLGYGNIEGPTVQLTDAEVCALAESVGGTVEEVETARVDA